MEFDFIKDQVESIINIQKIAYKYGYQKGKKDGIQEMKTLIEKQQKELENEDRTLESIEEEYRQKEGTRLVEMLKVGEPL